jgi:tRNA (guanine-N7-)-methyltransferase
MTAVSRAYSSDDHSEEQDIRFYGRRKGKPLKAGRKALLADLLPKVAIPVTKSKIDPAHLFAFQPDAVWLEIGFGSGEHLAAQAAAHPGIGIIGSEVFLNGVAGLLQHVDAQNLTNVRVFHEDVRRLLPALPDASLQRVFLLFPDPWPKARHAKRRFVSPAILDTLARLLVDDGELRVASDHPIYIRWTLTHATQSQAFRWVVSGPEDWRERPADAIATRYELKARAAGRAPAFMRFVRLPRSAGT